MSRTDWKLKREEALKVRLPYALGKLKKAGIKASVVDSVSVRFYVNEREVRFYPFTGGIYWQGKEQVGERGIRNLIRLVKNERA